MRFVPSKVISLGSMPGTSARQERDRIHDRRPREDRGRIQEGQAKAPERSLAIVHVRATALGLTSREARGLAHVAEGYSDAETAHKLGISIDAVRYSIRTAMVRLGAVNRPHAVALAVAHGVLELRE